MNEQRRDFFKNSALGLATITLGAGLSLIPSAQAEEKASNTATTAVENLPEIEAELTLAPNVPKPIERNYPAKVVVKLTALEQIMERACAVYSCARRRHGGSATFQLSEFNDATQYRFPCCSRTNGRSTRK